MPISLPVLVFTLVATTFAADEPGGSATLKDPTTQTEADWLDDRWTKTEIGQFLRTTIETPGRRTPQGIAVKIGERDQATICFDVDTLRYVAGWTGGFLKLNSQRYGLMGAVSPAGEIRFQTKPGPGWAANGSFADPRPRGLGPMPNDWAHYEGLYRCGKRIAFKYTVGNLEVLDSPWFIESEGKLVFQRSLEINGTGELMLRAPAFSGDVFTALESGRAEKTPLPDGEMAIRIECAGHQLARIDFGGRILAEPEALEPLTKGGPSRWGEGVLTKGIVGRENGPFAIDTISVPYANPWNVLMFTSGHDFLPNGDAIVSTIHGDAWLVSGIDRELRDLRWKRFATGLYQPLGLKVRDGKVFVMERDQITILRDLNGDGEADFYENFNNDTVSAGGGHSYATSLETDSKGNFYFTKCSENTPQGGTIVRVSADGRKLDVVATGFRNPNGLGVGPGDLVTVADQQGEWVPETRLDIIKPGGFYGYMPMHKRASAPTSFDSPLCWIPRVIDNSAGGQAWIPDRHWGELGGQMIHLSYGRCSMMLILRDGVNGGIVPLPGRFLSGAMRGRFHDDALYVSGLRGWQTAAIRDGCFQRVRRTGTRLLAPVAFKVGRESIELTFDCDLDPELARDASSYAAEEWNYKWSAQYGSADYSLRATGHTGRDKVPLASAALKTPRTVALKFTDPLQPVNTFRLTYSLESSTGEEIRGDFFCTINQP